MDRPREIGMAWYRREDYGELRALMADADRLPATFELWLMSAEQVEREVERSGVAVSRTMIAPDAFIAWCRLHAVPANAASRARYANENIAPQPGATGG